MKQIYDVYSPSDLQYKRAYMSCVFIDRTGIYKGAPPIYLEYKTRPFVLVKVL